MLGPGPPVPSADSLSGQGQPSSSDTESDFYEEIEVSCTPDCATGNAEYQHSKGSHLVPPLPDLPTTTTVPFISGQVEDTPFPWGRMACGGGAVSGAGAPEQLFCSLHLGVCEVSCVIPLEGLRVTVVPGRMSALAQVLT